MTTTGRKTNFIPGQVGASPRAIHAETRQCPDTNLLRIIRELVVLSVHRLDRNR